MEDDILDLFDFLSKPNETISFERRQRSASTATTLLIAWDKLSEENRNSLLNTLYGVRETKAPMQRCFIESMLYAITKKEEHLQILADHILKVPVDIASGVSNFYALLAMHFRASPDERSQLERYVGHEVMQTMFEKNLNITNELHSAITGPNTPAFEKNGVVALLAKQFLKPPHAPSVRALNFARALIKNHGKQPIILVTQEHPAQIDGCIMPSNQGNMEKSLLSAASLNWQDVTIPFAFLSDGPINEDSVSRGLDAINSLNPEMIIAIGSPSLFAETYSNSRFCFLYQTISGLPHVKDCYFHTWEALTPAEQQQLDTHGLNNQHLFVQHPGFERKEAQSTLQREDLDIPQDAFVFAIVGMRLHMEIDSAFLDMLEDIAAQNKRAFFAFAGNFHNHAELLAQHPALAKHAKYVGFHNDIMAFYGICDAFLNPIRKGGGGGIVYAMQAGLPSLSTDFGDASTAVANFDTITNYDDMAKTAITLMEDPAFYKDYADKSVEEARQFSDGDKIVARIVEEFEKYAGARLAPQH